jgi:alkaline phosphatase
MGVSQIASGMIKNGDTLNLERFPYSGLIKTWSADNLTPEYAVSLTALATGHKVYNSHIGMSSDGKPLKNLMEWAKEKKMATGLVTTSSVTHSSPASFIAHVSNWNDQEAIALEYLKLDMDVIIGGGSKFFETRADKRNLLQEFKDKGYELEDKQKKVGKIHADKILALVAENGLLDYKQRKDYLPKATENAMQMLYGKSGTGFFMLIDGSQIDWAGRGNDINYLTGEMIDFDKAVGKALDYFGKNPETLIIVVSSQERGGLAITDGNLKTGDVKVKWASEKPTAALVPVFAIGPGAEQFSGIHDNTEIFEKILSFIAAR